MYINRPLEDYLDDLAAKKATPGGGSAAALTAATGTSLMSMVANFTIGKSDYKDVEDKVAEILVAVEKHGSELRNLIDEDIEAYDKLSAALKQRSCDDAGMDEFYKNALEAPFLVCEMTGKCIKLCRDLVEIGNKQLVTDTAIAALFLEAAFLSAKLNVYVNLKYIKDSDYIAKIRHLMAALEEPVPKLKEEILEICEKAITKGWSYGPIAGR